MQNISASYSPGCEGIGLGFNSSFVGTETVFADAWTGWLSTSAVFEMIPSEVASSAFAVPDTVTVLFCLIVSFTGMMTRSLLRSFQLRSTRVQQRVPSSKRRKPKGAKEKRSEETTRPHDDEVSTKSKTDSLTLEWPAALHARCAADEAELLGEPLPADNTRLRTHLALPWSPQPDELAAPDGVLLGDGRVVDYVAPDSPAAFAGVLPGMRLVRVRDQMLKLVADGNRLQRAHIMSVDRAASGEVSGGSLLPDHPQVLRGGTFEGCKLPGVVLGSLPFGSAAVAPGSSFTVGQVVWFVAAFEDGVWQAAVVRAVRDGTQALPKGLRVQALGDGVRAVEFGTSLAHGPEDAFYVSFLAQRKKQLLQCRLGDAAPFTVRRLEVQQPGGVHLVVNTYVLILAPHIVDAAIGALRDACAVAKRRHSLPRVRPRQGSLAAEVLKQPVRQFRIQGVDFDDRTRLSVLLKACGDVCGASVEGGAVFELRTALEPLQLAALAQRCAEHNMTLLTHLGREASAALARHVVSVLEGGIVTLGVASDVWVARLPIGSAASFQDLGLSLRRDADTGLVRVRAVSSGSPADLSGVTEGMYVERVSGRPIPNITSAEAALSALSEAEAETVDLELRLPQRDLLKKGSLVAGQAPQDTLMVRPSEPVCFQGVVHVGDLVASSPRHTLRVGDEVSFAVLCRGGDPVADVVSSQTPVFGEGASSVKTGSPHGPCVGRTTGAETLPVLRNMLKQSQGQSKHGPTLRPVRDEDLYIALDPQEVQVFSQFNDALMGSRINVRAVWALRSGALEERFEQTQRELAARAGRPLDVVYAYHGTKEDNLLNIARHGFDPKRRSGQAYGAGEYFAVNSTVSMQYAAGGGFVFLSRLLLCEDRHRYCSGPQYLVMRQDEDRTLCLPQYLVQFGLAQTDVARKLPPAASPGQVAVPVRHWGSAVVAGPAQAVFMGWLPDDLSAEEVEGFFAPFEVDSFAQSRACGEHVMLKVSLRLELTPLQILALGRRTFRGAEITVATRYTMPSTSDSQPPQETFQCFGGQDCVLWNRLDCEARCTQRHHSPLPRGKATVHKLGEGTKVTLLQAKGIDTTSMRCVHNPVLAAEYQASLDALRAVGRPTLEREMWLVHSGAGAVHEMLHRGVIGVSNRKAHPECPLSGGKGLSASICGNACSLCVGLRPEVHGPGILFVASAAAAKRLSGGADPPLVLCRVLLGKTKVVNDAKQVSVDELLGYDSLADSNSVLVSSPSQVLISYLIK